MNPVDQLRAALAGKRVAYVHDWLTVPGGAEEVLRRMLELFPATVITAQYNPEKFPWIQEIGIEVRCHWISHLPFSKTRHYLYSPVLADVYRSLNVSEFDVLIGASHTFAHNVRPRSDTAFYCCYHTPARALWAPEIDGRAGSGWLRSQIVRRLKRLDLAASHNPTYIVTNSNTIKERVERVYGRQVDGVLYPPVDIDKFAKVERVSDEAGFLVYGRQISYKRTDLAIEAAKRMGFKLQVVGSGPMLREWQALAAGHPNIVFHGRLTDRDLLKLMGRCKGYLFPAYEDFGIVVVEAQAAGLPVIAYREGGASETVTRDSGVFMQEQTVDSLCAAISEFDKRQFDSKSVRAGVQDFGVARFQREHARYVTEAVARPGARCDGNSRPRVI